MISLEPSVKQFFISNHFVNYWEQYINDIFGSIKKVLHTVRRPCIKSLPKYSVHLNGISIQN